MLTNKAFQAKRLQRHPEFFLKPLALAVSLMCLCAAHTAVHADPGITNLGTLATNKTDRYSNAYGVNAVGDVVVGDANDDTSLRAFRWTEADGMIDLGTLWKEDGLSKGRSTAYGVNAVGDVVVGEAEIAANVRRAFRWTLNAGSNTEGTMIDLGTLWKVDGSSQGTSTAWGVNAIGDVVVGDAAIDANVKRAFRWTEADGMIDLGTLWKEDGLSKGRSTAYGVNAVGDVVVGEAEIAANVRRAFRWTLDAGSNTQGTMTNLGTLRTDNGGLSYAFGVNASGDVVVGGADSGSGLRAFRWTLNAGSNTQGTMTNLGTLRTDDNGYSYSSANAVNAAGDVVVGISASNDGSYRAFRWADRTGMQSIEDWLTANGVTVNPDAPKTLEAAGVNAAGDVVVGYLDENYHAFIATTKGLLDQVENNRSLAGASGTLAYAMQDASLVMHGAHGSPMRGLLTAGKQSSWIAGDWGYSDNRGNNGHLGAGEIGYGRGLNDRVMVKFALGRTYSKQDTLLGGNTKVKGTYIVPELIAKLSDTPLYASVSGYTTTGAKRMSPAATTMPATANTVAAAPTSVPQRCVPDWTGSMPSRWVTRRLRRIPA